MPNQIDNSHLEAAGSWAKKYFLASRALMESELRPYDLGSTQWYVLSVLATDGPTNQRDLTDALQIERATLSAIIGALVRKGLIGQEADPGDQRQKVLRITAAGTELWRTLPDPIALITEVAFGHVDVADVETTNRVLREATLRLIAHKKEAQKL